MAHYMIIWWHELVKLAVNVYSNVYTLLQIETRLLKLINNSSSLDKGNPNRDGDLDSWSQLADFDDFTSPFIESP